MTSLLNNAAPYDTFSEEALTLTVHSFYDKVRTDAYLSPVFDAHITDWTPHLARMVSFWSTVLGTEARYTRSNKGAPPQMHQAIPELEIPHFAHWLELWDATTNGVYVPELAQHIQATARRMAHVLSAHLTGPAAPLVDYAARYGQGG